MVAVREKDIKQSPHFAVVVEEEEIEVLQTKHIPMSMNSSCNYKAHLGRRNFSSGLGSSREALSNTRNHSRAISNTGIRRIPEPPAIIVHLVSSCLEAESLAAFDMGTTSLNLNPRRTK